MTIILPIATPNIFEVIRRIGARRMNTPRLSVECFPVVDEFGHRKWNVRVNSQKAPIKADIVAIGRPMVGPLNRMLTNENPKVRQLATEALDEITKK